MGDETQRTAPEAPNGLLQFIAGVVLGLLALGLPMIGVTINLVFGSIILALTFGLIAWGCWIWEGRFLRSRTLRIITISLAAGVYFSAVGIQIRAQYKKDHPVVQPSPPAVVVTPSPSINQTSLGSDCSNLVAESGSQIKCDDAKKEHHEKDKNSH